ncbi:helix-turn-helix domain-containing protein [Halomicrobium mukohataei]|uniref:Helix-turn-helix domain-containing protein n=1 Tax=Halomicrobium mukohataei TaxID=57705 RepID=A0A847UH29_9EURY|nr:helix-turn-helix domain-containing protein [Halomicrobium mukohataei]NLV11557.1 helix-turn-helix domain-containing protein [Halomicrobium mukohataei]
MSGLIDRIQDRATTTSQRARVLEMTEGDADEVLDALASDTGRATFQALFEEPRTPSEIADRVDTSVQNVHYHLSNLEDAELVEPVDTIYSEKGNEMTVYGPASDPLVFVGDDARTPAVRQSVTDVVGGIGVLAAASLFVQWGAERLMRRSVRPPSAVGPASPDTTVAPPDGSIAWVVFEVVEPGVLFFFGALLVATVALLAVRRAPSD